MDFGAGGRIRTPDLLITNQLLYQLSYTSKYISNSRVYDTRGKQFCQPLFSSFFIFKGGTILYHIHRRSKRQTTLHCTLCGREIITGEEYWACNGSQICTGCLPEFARQELAPCRETRGKEQFL